MRENKIMEQIGAIFGIFMTFFYVGVGIYFIISPIFESFDKVLLNIVGGTFIFYGLYRGFRTFMKIREAFFPKKKRPGENDN